MEQPLDQPEGSQTPKTGRNSKLSTFYCRAMGGSMPFQDALKARLDLMTPSRKMVDLCLREHPPRLSPGAWLFLQRANKRVVELLLSSRVRCCFCCRCCSSSPDERVAGGFPPSSILLCFSLVFGTACIHGPRGRACRNPLPAPRPISLVFLLSLWMVLRRFPHSYHTSYITPPPQFRPLCCLPWMVILW